MKESGHFLKDLEEPVNRYLHVPLAGTLVGFLKKTTITPNQITYASIFFGLWSGYVFSRGGASSMVWGGILLEVTLILDCVDGQLARATGKSSEWGRLLDGIAGYIAYGAVVIGIMAGMGAYYGSLAWIALLTILRAISYDYCKQSMTSLVRNGYDGNQREILETFQKMRKQRSAVLRSYFYYLQFQQFLFQGHWVSLSRFTEEKRKLFEKTLLTEGQREQYYQKAKFMMAVWKWNGLDLPLFLIALFAILGTLDAFLTPMAYFMGVQYLVTLCLHRFLLRNENNS